MNAGTREIIYATHCDDTATNVNIKEDVEIFVTM